MGAREVNEAIAAKLGVGEHGTSSDGKYSFATEECLGACEFAPCLLINEKLHHCLKPGDVPKLLADADNDRIDLPRSSLYDGVEIAEDKTTPAGDEAAGKDTAKDAGKGNGQADGEPKAATGREKAHGADDETDNLVETTSDVQEMKDAD
jgi:hypothetical protein